MCVCVCVCVCVCQVNDLLERQLVEEAVLLAETIAAVEASKSTTAAEEVHVHVRTVYLHVHVHV